MKKVKNISVTFNPHITVEDFDDSVNKLLENFDTDQEVKVSYEADSKNLFVNIEVVKAPHLRVIK